MQACLWAAEDAMKETGQNYTITTFNMSICMIAFLSISQNFEGYKDHIILTRTFHLEYASIKMLGKKLRGSGLEDALLDSRLISGGSLARVMQEEHYDWALHFHKVLSKALKELLLKKLCQELSEILSPLLPDAQRKINILLQSLTLCHMIAKSHSKSPDLKWPPVPDDLEKPDMPDALTMVLTYIMYDQNTPNRSHTQTCAVCSSRHLSSINQQNLDAT